MARLRIGVNKYITYRRRARSPEQVLAEDKPCTWDCTIYFTNGKVETNSFEARSNAEARKMAKERHGKRYTNAKIRRVDCHVSQHYTASSRAVSCYVGPDGGPLFWNK